MVLYKISKLMFLIMVTRCNPFLHKCILGGHRTHIDCMIGLNATYHDLGEETHVRTILAGDNQPAFSGRETHTDEKGKCKPRLQHESSNTKYFKSIKCFVH